MTSFIRPMICEAAALLEPILDGAQAYWSQVPNCTRAAISGFTWSAVLGGGLSARPESGVLLGAAAVTASVIHALATPFFRYVFEENNEFDGCQNMIMRVFSVLVASHLFKAAGFRREFMGNLGFNLFAAFFSNGPSSVYQGNTFVFFS